MTETTVASFINDILRGLCRFLDGVVYWLLVLMYQIFFNVASAELFTNETIKNFYGRVQLILGVFMIFKLAISIVKGIVNPDSFTDKNNGMGNIIYRIMFSLVMLTIIAPINIPNARNEYEIQLNNNGLLFGTLYSLQNRILSNNTLGRLILGTTDGNYAASNNNSSSVKKKNQELKESANMLASTVLKGFVRINIKEGTDDEKKSKNWMCSDIPEDALTIYTNLNADPEQILGLTNLKCDSKDASLIGKVLNSDQRYMFAYKGFISAIVGGVFVYVLISFTIDIAVRAIKLAILRLLAPIPIIAYIDPSGEKNTFNSWTKLLTSTYLDLFIRLSIIYFVIYLIQDIIKNGLVMNQASGLVGILTYIFIFLGLFIFAKQAPKFIKQIFGMKDDGGKLFGGLGEALGIAGGVGAAAIGSIGSFAAGMKASRMADETRQAFGENVNPNSFLNKGKHLLAGFAGGASGLGTGMKTAFTAKDHAARSTFEAMQKHNAQSLNAGDAGSTLWGRTKAVAARAFTGDAPGASIARSIASMDSRRKALDAIKKRASGEMVKSLDTRGNLYKDADKKDMHGNIIGEVNYKSFMSEFEAAKSTGSNTVKFKNAAGDNMEISLAAAYDQSGYLLKTNESSYIEQVVGGTITDGTLTNLIQDAEAKGGAVAFSDTGEALFDAPSLPISDRDSVTKTMEAIDNEVTNQKRRNVINEANDRFSGGKK